MGRHRHTCLGISSLLLATDQTVRERGLCELRAAWLVIDCADKQSLVSPAVKRVAAAVPWTNEIFTRELLGLLACHDFKLVSPPALHMVRSVFEGLCQTAVVENGHRSIRALAGGGSGGGVASILTRYERPHFKEVLKDSAWGQRFGSIVFVCCPSCAFLNW